MHTSQPHMLQRSHIHSNGAEEWACPICGRKILIDWQGLHRSAVLIPGDASTSHIGGAGNQRTEASQVIAEQQTEYIAEEVGTIPISEPLRPWLRWMQTAGLAH
jgi:hypothetical protein